MIFQLDVNTLRVFELPYFSSQVFFFFCFFFFPEKNTFLFAGGAKQGEV